MKRHSQKFLVKARRRRVTKHRNPAFEFMQNALVAIVRGIPSKIEDLWQPLYERVYSRCEELGFLDTKNRPCRYRRIRILRVEFDGPCRLHVLYRGNVRLLTGSRGPYVNSYCAPEVEIKRHEELRVCCSAAYVFEIIDRRHKPRGRAYPVGRRTCSGCGVVQKYKHPEHTLCLGCFREMIGVPTYLVGMKEWRPGFKGGGSD